MSDAAVQGRKFKLVFEVQDLGTGDHVVEKSETVIDINESELPGLTEAIKQNPDMPDGELKVWAAFFTACRFIQHRMSVEPARITEMKDTLRRMGMAQ